MRLDDADFKWPVVRSFKMEHWFLDFFCCWRAIACPTTDLWIVDWCQFKERLLLVMVVSKLVGVNYPFLQHWSKRNNDLHVKSIILNNRHRPFTIKLYTYVKIINTCKIRAFWKKILVILTAKRDNLKRRKQIRCTVIRTWKQYYDMQVL